MGPLAGASVSSVHAMRQDGCAILFLRQPDRGQVKTRLAAVAGTDRATDLYRCFVEDTVSMLDGLQVHTKCFYDGADGSTYLNRWLGESRWYARQRGDDLGRRMANAFRDVFAAGFSRAVLIGSDLPDLPGEMVRNAFSSLDAHDAVIGPSTDGGYYLIGFTASSFLPAAFDGVPWSTDRVFEETMESLDSGDVKTSVLPPWQDVDTWEDIGDLIRRSRRTSFRESRTWAFLGRCGWIDGMEGSDGDV